jgi:hypothetical protein
LYWSADKVFGKGALILGIFDAANFTVQTIQVEIQRDFARRTIKRVLHKGFLIASFLLPPKLYVLLISASLCTKL